MAFPQRMKTKIEGLHPEPASGLPSSQDDPEPTGNPQDDRVVPDPNSAPASAGQSILVPRAAIDMHGSTPEDGDPVEFSVTGTKTGEEGENYRITVTTANGKDVPMDDEGAGDDPSENESSDAMEGKLRGMFP